jgi:transcriptional regulator with GAF, ATPase, and Fis domain
VDETEHYADCEPLEKLLRDNEALLEENRALQEKLRRENISLQEHDLALQGELADIQRNTFEPIIGRSPLLQRTLIHAPIGARSRLMRIAAARAPWIRTLRR